ncbi:MAG TPA: DUF5916 domain-containing protein [Longimicrobiales bacterium]|nr:DUF5916 domain-containing protein [Longimicrobiales bacterium]
MQASEIARRRLARRPARPPGRIASSLGLALALSLAPPAAAQTPGGGDGGLDDRGKQALAVRLAGQIELDGSPSEDVWARAEWFDDFVQKEPVQGAAPSVRTEIAFLYDDQALWIGARMETRDPVNLERRLTRRDEAGNAERLIVSLDTYQDGRTAYTFAVTAGGVRLDWYHPGDDEYHRDGTFDPVWQARTALDPAFGWTAELRIPISQLRFARGEEQDWGLNINRYIPDGNEDLYWVLIDREETGWSSRMGSLDGITGLTPSRRLEVLPYVASEATFRSEGAFDAANPFLDEADATARVGVDVKMGLGPNLTLDATLNPDFGQVEADPAVVDLSGFETFFDERRQFFIEGAQNFTTQGANMYFSRRIGARPRGRVVGDFVDVPRTSSILGAAKLTGRLESGLTVGVVAAVTDQETASAFDGETGRISEFRVEPRTAFGALRLNQQFGPDASTVGMMLTAVARDMGELDAGEPLFGAAAERAYAGGLDLHHRASGGTYNLYAHVNFSHVAGDPEAITNLQTNRIHAFQRPDQDHVEVDPLATSMSGVSAALRGNKQTGRLRYNGGVWLNSPSFEINDLGRLTDPDRIWQWAFVRYRSTDPGKVFRQWEVETGLENGWNLGGERINTWLLASAWAQWSNFWFSNLRYSTNLRAQSDTQTRGGPLMLQPRGWNLNGSFDSNYNNDTRYGLSLNVFGDELGGGGFRLGSNLVGRLTDRLEVSFQPRFASWESARQFVSSLADGREETFGSRYVFGVVDRREVAAPMRANVGLSPDLSFELYAEPFAASGDFLRLGELAAPRTVDLLFYGTDIPATEQADGSLLVRDGDAEFVLGQQDFHILSFRSNAVVRWEWRPGSTLFVVWQQNRSSSGSDGSAVGFGQLGDAVRAEGENVLAVKLTYWLPM